MEIVLLEFVELLVDLVKRSGCWKAGRPGSLKAEDGGRKSDPQPEVEAK